MSQRSLKTLPEAAQNYTVFHHHIVAAVAAELHHHIAAATSPHHTVAADTAAVPHNSAHQYPRLRNIQRPNCLLRNRCHRRRSRRRGRRGDLGSTWFVGDCLRVRYCVEGMEGGIYAAE
jgi:hypothetical protein